METAFEKLKTTKGIPSQLMIEHSGPGVLALTGNTGSAKYVTAKARDTTDMLHRRIISFIHANYTDV